MIPTWICRGVRVQSEGDPAASDWIPCGAPLDDLVAQVPADGEEHVVECPVCGSEKKFKKIPKE